MAGSFCTLINNLFGPGTNYHRGRSLDGLATKQIAKSVREKIDALPAADRAFLVGYGRGGAATIQAEHMGLKTRFAH